MPTPLCHNVVLRETARKLLDPNNDISKSAAEVLHSQPVKRWVSPDRGDRYLTRVQDWIDLGPALYTPDLSQQGPHLACPGLLSLHFQKARFAYPAMKGRKHKLRVHSSVFSFQ